ncbi:MULTISPECIES: ATP/GTP-binding protein [unclassified Mesotoga]|uniref:AAA family ATPase n=1 Tax=unclassified Mesotoga TaxID=1184398 RepID=UPI000CCE0E2B|nr:MULTISPECIES: AAA family ATPase [unclassified Mesotoga]PNS37009.1 ATPase AAA [Mesotoga sp. B105.6.4]PVD16222.1 ATPase AAA [Mesotoga sp. Brook.08.105.5.1]
MEGAIKRLTLTNFTAFRKLDLECSPGINIFIGSNATGKTHILKCIYAACDITRTKEDFANKLLRVFLPYGMKLGRLVRRQQRSSRASIVLENMKENKIELSFSNHVKIASSANVKGQEKWLKTPIECAYIPVKEMLAHAPGFRSLYNSREIHFEEIYPDIIDRAYKPILRGRVDQDRQQILTLLQDCMDGRVTVKDEEFFLKNTQGNLEFSLLAEGLRKLALLWLLIQNGTLLEGSILFWDEPESNLNPEMIASVVGSLLRLQRLGVQIFLATHDYVVLKQFDLQAEEEDRIRYHSLKRKETKEIVCESEDSYDKLGSNSILATYEKMYHEQIMKTMDAHVDSIP